ncbi:MAG TPA: PAS domain-containing sensor histidine kinase, partial [Gillisia sp.]|nr:PAS domain-containing sensor histidine kinase [Gillisia sp.]
IDSGRPKYSIDGKYEGMIGTVVDVQEEKIKEQKLADTQHQYRELIHSSTSLISTFKGEDYIIEIANDAILEAWGKGREVIGKPLLEALPELVEQGFDKILKDVYTTGVPFRGYEMPINLERDGKLEPFHFNFIYSPQKNINGEIVGIVNVATDVTSQAVLNKTIRESESHFRQMADLMPTKVSNTDSAGKFIYFNQGWMDYTGLTSEELRVQGWVNLIHANEREIFMNRWQLSFETGVDFEMELRLLNKQGKYRWHLSRAEPVRGENGKISMWISTNTEIQKLKEEEKRKGDFLKMVSHELKTPVTSIKGYVQLLLSMLRKQDADPGSSTLPLKPSLERIDHQINRLTRLISEMLDLSRIEENKLELQKQVFGLNELVDHTVQDIRYTNTQHEIEVIHEFKCKVFADKDRIGQVLINFITNAIKYSPESKDIIIRIRKHENNQVSVSVKDQGIGIEKKNHKNIFKRFYRIGGKGEETYSGFGIGLYLAREIVERHDGSITVKSKKGKGSDFCFILSVASEK